MTTTPTKQTLARYQVESRLVMERYPSFAKDLWRLLAVVGDGPTPDSVHDLRVDARRTQAILSILPKKFVSGMDDFDSSLKSLLKVTSGLRDIDIIIAVLDALNPAPISSGKFAERRESEASRTKEAAKALLRVRVPQLHLGEQAGRKLTKKLRRRLAQRTDSIMLLLESALESERRVKKLHQLRVEMKKLRYLLELSEGVSKERIALSEWQDKLGRIHDYDITLDHLSGDGVAKDALQELRRRRHQAYIAFVKLSQRPRSKWMWKEIESRL